MGYVVVEPAVARTGVDSEGLTLTAGFLLTPIGAFNPASFLLVKRLSIMVHLPSISYSAMIDTG